MSFAPVLCDWLDVTYPPDRHIHDDLVLFLTAGDFEFSRDGTGVFSPNKGFLKYGEMYGVYRVSVSGKFLSYLRSEGVYSDFLWILCTVPHRVTRLDAALDVERDGADVLAELRSSHPQSVKLSRKSMGVTVLSRVRSDGRETGTFYVGHRSKARLTARVYDKQDELFCKEGLIVPPRTRYELTFRKDKGVTLRDAYEPDRVFWSHVGPLLDERPEGVAEWSADWGLGWSAEKGVDRLPAEVIERRISHSSELAALLNIADQHIGVNGRVFLARQLLDRLGVDAGDLTVRSLVADLVGSGG